MSKGLFITFEGADGCGKTTQIKLFAEYLKEQGYDVVLSREPGGTPISEKIRHIILDASSEGETDITEMLLFAAARAQHVAQLIRPAVNEGKIVLCDRFVDSSIAYQAYARNLGDVVETVNEIAVDGCYPDMTFFLDISPKAARERNSHTDKDDRLEMESLDFHTRVYEGYLKIRDKNGKRYISIDASKGIDEVFEEIKKEFNARIKS